MRAREFIQEQTASATIDTANPTTNTSKVKDIAKKVGSKSLSGFDKATNVLGLAQGAGIVGDQSAANFVGDQMKTYNTGVALQGLSHLSRNAAPMVSKGLGMAGTVAKTATGPYATAATLAVRHGDAGKAYGPYADTHTGVESWMTKHGYDPAKSGERQRARDDYEAARKNWQDAPIMSKLRRIVDPSINTIPDDDELMTNFRKPDIK